MNIETRLDPRLWQSIQNSYESRNYTGAILDALYFLNDLIREKTGLGSDGITLAGQAFGGNSPKLKVNKLQSESDWNVQRGTEQLLRGIYQSIRNPRSHEKYTDTAEDAESIIFFINYLTKIIDQSKPPFTKSAFLKRVFDPDFVETEKYAKLLVKEIPVKQRLEIFIDVYRQKETGSGKKLRYFVSALLNRLNKEEKSQVYQLVSEELKHTDSKDTLRLSLQILPSSCWKHLEEVARLRIENKLIESIKDGRYIEEKEKCLSGALGTWATNIKQQHYLLKYELIDTLLRKLRSSDITEQDYVFSYFFDYLTHLEDPPRPRTIRIITKGLDDGDKRFYDALFSTMEYGLKSWKEAFKKPFENFVESEPTREVTEDDIPF